MNLNLDPSLLLNMATTKVSPEKSGQDPKALRNTCQEFEAIFVQQLFKGMRSTVPEGGLMENGMKGEVFRDMMDMEIARSAASGKGLGIAEALYRQLLDAPTESD
ncbi:rod-binding protein [Desulfuromonas sp.]|uniref:rod-binding protein n=1 Tax=Desulfuromonas sp. TaxID=892 RepID=UPI0025B9A522|nr:rod-binding protein [Desulfuromonas sp.]